MKYKVFDVVKLKNSNKATILNIINKKKYFAEIVNESGQFDMWNANKAGWGNWAMPLYKALYPSSADGLDDSDLDDFSNEISEEDYLDEEGNTVGSDIYSGTSSSDKGKKTASKANRQTKHNRRNKNSFSRIY